MTIRVVVSISTQSDKGHLQEAAFAALAPVVRAESGCLQYDLHRVVGIPDAYVLLEEWESEAALEAHNASAHMAEAGQANKSFRAGPAQVMTLEGDSVG